MPHHQDITHTFSLTVDNATDCESLLPFILKSFTLSMSDLNYVNSFLPNGSLFLKYALSAISCKKKIVVLEFEKIEDMDLPKSAFSLKVLIFVFLCWYKVLTNWARKPDYQTRDEPRYFIRKHLRVRYRKKQYILMTTFTS